MIDDIIDLGKNPIDSEGHLRVLKGGRGVALFCEQRIKSQNPNKDNEVLFANKVLSHEQALDLRDFLVRHYPLDGTEEA